MSIFPSPPPQNHYAVLGLPPPQQQSPRTRSNKTQAQPLTTSQIKAAYRRALLNHHPDKSPATYTSPPLSPSTTLKGPSQSIHAEAAPHSRNGSAPSIDSITLARDTLLNPLTRRHYDQQLQRQSLLHNALQTTPSTDPTACEAVNAEVVDLDDMEFDPGRNEWRLECRCGDEEAFRVREQDLLDAMHLSALGTPSDLHGSRGLLVGCPGCSLTVKVLFSVAENDDDDDNDNESNDVLGLRARLEHGTVEDTASWNGAGDDDDAGDGHSVP